MPEFDHPPRRRFEDDRAPDIRGADESLDRNGWQHGGASGNETLRPSVAAQAGVQEFSLGPDRPARSPMARPGSRVALLAAGVVGAAAIGLVVIAGDETSTGSVVADAAEMTEAAPPRPVLRDLGGDVTLAAGDAPLITRVAAIGRPRLPRTVDELWRADLVVEADGEPTVVAADDALVVVSPRSDGGVVTVQSYDAATGDERWRREIATVSEVHMLGAVGDAVVLQHSDQRIGSRHLSVLDASTGTDLWVRELAEFERAVIEPVPDALLVQRFAERSENGSVERLDPSTGDVMVDRRGQFVGIDTDQQLVTRAGSKILTSAVPASRDVTRTDVLGVVTRSDAPFALVGRSLVWSPTATGPCRGPTRSFRRTRTGSTAPSISSVPE